MGELQPHDTFLELYGFTVDDIDESQEGFCFLKSAPPQETNAGNGDYSKGTDEIDTKEKGITLYTVRRAGDSTAFQKLDSQEYKDGNIDKAGNDGSNEMEITTKTFGRGPDTTVSAKTQDNPGGDEEKTSKHDPKQDTLSVETEIRHYSSSTLGRDVSEEQVWERIRERINPKDHPKPNEINILHLNHDTYKKGVLSLNKVYLKRRYLQELFIGSVITPVFLAHIFREGTAIGHRQINQIDHIWYTLCFAGRDKNVKIYAIHHNDLNSCRIVGLRLPDEYYQAFRKHKYRGRVLHKPWQIHVDLLALCIKSWEYQYLSDLDSLNDTNEAFGRSGAVLQRTNISGIHRNLKWLQRQSLKVQRLNTFTSQLLEICNSVTKAQGPGNYKPTDSDLVSELNYLSLEAKTLAIKYDDLKNRQDILRQLDYHWQAQTLAVIATIAVPITVVCSIFGTGFLGVDNSGNFQWSKKIWILPVATLIAYPGGWLAVTILFEALRVSIYLGNQFKRYHTEIRNKVFHLLQREKGEKTSDMS